MVTCLCFMTSGPSAGKTQVTGGGTDSCGLLYSHVCHLAVMVVVSRLDSAGTVSWSAALPGHYIRPGLSQHGGWPFQKVRQKWQGHFWPGHMCHAASFLPHWLAACHWGQLRFKGREVRVHLRWKSDTVPRKKSMWVRRHCCNHRRKQFATQCATLRNQCDCLNSCIKSA